MRRPSARRSLGKSLRRRFAAPALAAALLASLSAHRADACEMALVLAHDVSESVYWAEYGLQTLGHASAFRDPEVQQEILATGGITVMLMHWSGPDHQEQMTPWRSLTTADEMEAFATELANVRRTQFSQKTAIGDMLAWMEGVWAPVSDCVRRVVDVSGDGIANSGRTVLPARDRLVAQGLTINGLIVSLDTASEYDPYRYYVDRVIGGPGSFAMRSAGFEDYARVFKQKLLRELRGPPVVEQETPPGGAQTRPVGFTPDRSEGSAPRKHGS